MTVVIVGVLMLLVILFAYKHIRAVERKEEALEELDSYSEKVNLLDRGIDLLDRKEVIDTKINSIKERTKDYDNQ